jgi:hypothetical protein
MKTADATHGWDIGSDGNMVFLLLPIRPIESEAEICGTPFSAMHKFRCSDCDMFSEAYLNFGEEVAA